LSTNFTEEASRLRANAGSSIIQNELDLKEISRDFSGFTIKSTTADDLAEKELRRLLAVADRVAKLFQQVSSNTPIVCSAIASSNLPPNAAGRITPIIDKLDEATKDLKEASTKFSGFKDLVGFTEKRNTLENIKNIINQVLTKLKSVLDQLHLLLFGG
jgi:hypothetical protein